MKKQLTIIAIVIYAVAATPFAYKEAKREIRSRVISWAVDQPESKVAYKEAEKDKIASILSVEMPKVDGIN